MIQHKSSNSSSKGWLTRLRSGLSKSSRLLIDGIGELFTKHRLDKVTLKELEELLITADLGVETAVKLTGNLACKKFKNDLTSAEIRIALAEDIVEILDPVAQPLRPFGHKPFVVLAVGVNGSGKTTTLGKLACQWTSEGMSVMLAACDTFRAAAVEQLKIWGERAQVPVIDKPYGSDAAALAFDALLKAKATASDVLMIDTAGRLQNKTQLMEELAKLVRVIKKQDDTAPHATVLVLDGTVGQNAHVQTQVFREMVNVTGLIITKLDGSSRGGVVVSLAQSVGLPMHAVGVGEGEDDLHSFDARVFAHSLMGISE
ncbi:signal recognition particle-docking protein FtsY [Candidatus Endolissoclinum faulkneri L5]|uniref:Signal recognition particle receptor FtsY n=1 Tax=Candidatus Endolissoclinum faulkneri L5 TaxID=1401328 RepID=V9TUX5_9PROT|nr:signal recognition particle-docking protein FtsY [Candidatus Endolissoclinum faulkneri]AHC73498.1 signal recognition particle-docking protein FtsY [Candidatus Endolissoclinum faulkneri L5]